MSRIRESLTFGAIVACALGSCVSDEHTTSKAEFPQAMAEAACAWAIKCCDTAELGALTDAASSQSECVAKRTTRYETLFATADAKQWKSQAAQDLIDEIEDQALDCPKAFDPDVELAKATLVKPSKQPGDPCTTTWECTTKFCKNTVCANPLPLGSTCGPEEPCKEGLRCVSGTCRELQVDGASCQTGSECISGACGGGKCVVSTTWTCDGK